MQMKQGLYKFRTIILCSFVFISMFALQPGFAWAGLFSDEWEDAGFTKEESQALKECGFIVVPNNDAPLFKEGPNAYPWKKAGFSAKEACEWVRGGVSDPAAVQELKECNLDLHDLSVLAEVEKSLGSLLLSVHEYSRDTPRIKITLNEFLKKWRGTITAGDIDAGRCKILKTWKNAGYPFEELPLWLKEFDVNEAIEWKKNGVLPSQAKEYIHVYYLNHREDDDEIKKKQLKDPAGFVAEVLAVAKKGDDENKQWKDAGFTKEEISGEGFGRGWKDTGFSASEAKRWKTAGYFAPAARDFKSLLFSTPDEVKQFTAKYCKAGFAIRNRTSIDYPPANPNDDDGSHCYRFEGKVFQLLGDNEALYNDGYGGISYISFGKGGRAVSLIGLSIVTVKGSYKYQALAGIKVVPELKILKTIKQ